MEEKILIKSIFAAKTKNRETFRLRGFLAEKEGFEPSRPFRSLHDFQSCALDQLGDFSIAVPVRSAYELDLSSDSFIIIAKDGKMSTPKNKIF